MNREAAALGVPVYSIFRGKIGAVDRYLARTGKLTLLESVQDVQTKLVLESRGIRTAPQIESRPALRKVVDQIESIVELACQPAIQEHGR